MKFGENDVNGSHNIRSVARDTWFRITWLKVNWQNYTRKFIFDWTKLFKCVSSFYERLSGGLGNSVTRENINLLSYLMYQRN